MAIKMKDLELCGVKNTMTTSIKATSVRTMEKVLPIDIIQRFQSAFSLRANAFSQSIGGEITVDKTAGNNITHAKHQRLNRSKEITIDKFRKIASTMKGFPMNFHNLIDMDSYMTGVNDNKK